MTLIGRDGSAPGGTSRFETLLLATDLSPASSAATEQAIELAVRLGARLIVVHVFGGMQGLVPLSHGRTSEERDARATAAQVVVQRARAAGADATFLLWDGDAGDGIVAAADSEAADVIIVGSHGRTGVGRYLLGSVSDFVVHHASCPVLVVKPRESDVD